MGVVVDEGSSIAVACISGNVRTMGCSWCCQTMETPVRLVVFSVLESRVWCGYELNVIDFHVLLCLRQVRFYKTFLVKCASSDR